MLVSKIKIDADADGGVMDEGIEGPRMESEIVSPGRGEEGGS